MCVHSGQGMINSILHMQKNKSSRNAVEHLGKSCECKDEVAEHSQYGIFDASNGGSIDPIELSDRRKFLPFLSEASADFESEKRLECVIEENWIQVKLRLDRNGPLNSVTYLSHCVRPVASNEINWTLKWAM